MKSYSNYRALSRESLQGRWSEFAIVYLLLWVFSYSVGFSSTMDIENFGLLYSLVGIMILAFTIFFLVPFQYGYQNATLSVARSQEVQPFSETMFFFKRDYSRAIPTILLADLAIIGLSIVTLCIGGIILQYAYAMVPYLLRDYPELTPTEALRTSRQMMRGHKWELFILDLTFVGWYLLAILTFGIGLLWLEPYVHTAHAHYYLDLKDETIIDDNEDAITE